MPRLSPLLSSSVSLSAYFLSGIGVMFFFLFFCLSSLFCWIQHGFVLSFSSGGHQAVVGECRFQKVSASHLLALVMFGVILGWFSVSELLRFLVSFVQGYGVMGFMRL
ncbi:hypothetical protein BJ508DRAFT_163569 [Ascobolus immersus RN42]|uniref:Uncharacterized protein n=1 Tax=Ascobolus immersus RN42 TaxID=1160509 RepID=A0A3N4HZB4_ASCIM|nr:hypothetical protein BJ508DRAFT_163569 [Ascobolus immersus RN42]